MQDLYTQNTNFDLGSDWDSAKDFDFCEYLQVRYFYVFDTP